jgi:archaellum component FlaG (FlaF/FlaG flagellin family)
MKPHSLLFPLLAILTLTTLSAQAVPDVTVIGTPTVTQKPYYAGGPLTVTYTVKNIGNQPASASSTRVQIFTPVSTQYTTAEFPIAALAAGAQRTETHTVTNINTNAWTGTWEARVRLDTFFDIAGEFPTANNVATPAPFRLIATKWDLKFVNDEKPGPCPSVNAYGGTMRLAFFIHNDSSAPAPATKTRVQIYDRSHSSVVYDDVDTPAIPPDGKIPFVYSYQLPATGTTGGWSVFVHLNDFGVQGEATGFNNASDEVTFQVNAPGTAVAPCPITPGIMNPRVSGSNMVFELWGNAGTTLNITTSTDLANWVPLTSRVMANGVNTFTTPRNGPKRYYRAR